MALTIQQEAFAQAIASGKTQSDAYRAAYNVKPTTKAASVNQQAFNLLKKHPEINERVAELQKPIIEKVQVTLESHLKELEILRDLAKDKSQFGAAISAEVSRGKVAGLYTDNVNLTSDIPANINVIYK